MKLLNDADALLGVCVMRYEGMPPPPTITGRMDATRPTTKVFLPSCVRVVSGQVRMPVPVPGHPEDTHV